MATFKDRDRQEWLVEPTLGVCRRLKSRSENPIDVLNSESLAKAFDDPYERFDLLWAFCEEQAQELGVTINDFDKLLATEDAFASSGRALKESLTDFFLRIGMESLATVITDTVAARARLDKLAVDKIKSPKAQRLMEKAVEKADAAMDRKLDEAEQQLDEILGSKSTN
jgi:DNA-binding transcriptional MerR regulator